MVKKPGPDPVTSRRTRALVVVACATAASVLAGLLTKVTGSTLLSEVFAALAGTGAGILVVLLISGMRAKRRPVR